MTDKERIARLENVLATLIASLPHELGVQNASTLINILFGEPKP